MALITKEIYKAVIKTKGTGLDTRLDTYTIPMAEAIAAAWCHRTLESSGADVTEYFDGGEAADRRYLYPQAVPITALTSIHLDAARDFGANSLLTSSDYVQADKYIYLVNAAIPMGPRTCKLIYQGGYTAQNAPENLKVALVMVAAWLEGGAGKQHVASQSVADQNLATTYIKKLPDDVKLALSPFRRPPI